MIETERLILRPTSAEDGAFIHQLVNTPKWLRFIGDRNIHSPAEAAKYIEEKMRPQLKTHGFSNNTVIRKSDDKKLGTCGLYDRPGLEGIDIGFAFLPEFEGQGYGFEAASALLEKAFAEYGLNKVVAITLPENIISQNLLKKLGMKQVDTILLPPEEVEFLLFSIERGVPS